MVLYRPTGAAELALVEASGWRRWPPRLPEQPLFYPATNETYAAEIARRWNGEWWAPTEDLEQLDDHVVGRIEVVAEYR